MQRSLMISTLSSKIRRNLSLSHIRRRITFNVNTTLSLSLSLSSPSLKFFRSTKVHQCSTLSSTSSSAINVNDTSILQPILWDSTKALLHGIIEGDRTSLARAITLVESTRIEHRQQADILLDTLADIRKQQQLQYELSTSTTTNRQHQHVHVTTEPKTIMTNPSSTINTNKSSLSSSSFLPPYRSFRIGIAGPPGAGKSTLIETLGLYLVEQLKEKIAVIAIDPSSPRTGGSILGDKTRMNNLSRHTSAFVRPSPSRGALGGITTTTHDVINLCEAANFPIILVETVGLGQSETAVDNCVDMLWLVVPPGGGDELQGVKKGIVECADMIVINKADGDLLTPARHMAAEYTRAMQLVRPKHGFGIWYPPVLRCSALTNDGIPELWNKSKEFYTTLYNKYYFQQRRQNQAVLRVWTDFDNNLNRKVKMNKSIQDMAVELQEQVANGFLTSRKAAEKLVTMFLNNTQEK